MGSRKQTQRQTEDIDRTMAEQVTGIEPFQQQFQGQLGRLEDLFRTQSFGQPIGLTPLPGFSATPSPLVQAGVAQGVQNLRAQEAARQRQLAGALSIGGTGSNEALLAALSRQGGLQTAANINALTPIALEQQRAFDLQQQQLAEAQNRLQLSARQQQLAELTPQLNLLQLINEMARTSAGRTVRETGRTAQEVLTRKSRI